mgnify:CR=1 FL=1|tara:strand:+ start:10157 stop:10447 length:291 start_codon:yes stop_codon:yes gene_type:complete
MRHANPDDLKEMDGLLGELRKIKGLVEKKPGIFYRKSKAFLHFHEHESSLFADIRLTGTEFDRYPIKTQSDQARLLKLVRSIDITSETSSSRAISK